MKNWPENYKAIKNFEIIDKEDFKLIPIRYDDRYTIMKWRNEQIYHLRQKKKLSKYDQDKYFEEVVLRQKEEDNPDQILFSFLKKNKLVAYGGLVHINWNEKEAEVSFVMKTSHEEKNFNLYWDYFLKLLESIVLKHTNLITLCTYAFDLRPQVYKVLEKNKFVFFEKSYYLKNNQKINIIIHKKRIDGRET